MARHYAYRPIIGSCDKSACCLTGRSVQGHSRLYSRPYSPIINQSINQSIFLLARRYASAATSHACVCLSQVGVLSKRLNESCWFLDRSFLPSSLHCVTGNSAISKIRAFPSGTLSKTPDFENLPSVYLSSKRVIDLADKGEIVINWTVVDQLSWQYLRAPTLVH